jgi:hypothetical protein
MNDRIAAAALVLCLYVCSPGKALAQTTPPAGADGAANAKDMRSEPSLSVKLIDADQKAAKHSATVSVKVSGLKLIDPASVKEKPAKGQGHLHYQVDDGFIIATTTTKLSFHGLASGPHSFKVILAANDHTPLGPSQTVNVTIP